MNHEALIQTFYESFSQKDAEAMVACYHDDIVFEDPAFGVLKGEDARNMWRMLVTRGGESMKIDFEDIHENEKGGFATWHAAYTYGPKKRKVLNHVSAHFTFQDGKIIRHSDHFDMWRWTRQALGLSGYLLGWTPFMKRKIQQRTNSLLRSYVKAKSTDR